ncbi:MAG: SGNH/GDSL hydrolase family protein [Francisellaceae bacterium]
MKKLTILMSLSAAMPLTAFATAGADITVFNRCPYTVTFVSGNDNLSKVDFKLRVQPDRNEKLGYFKDSSSGIGFTHNDRVEGSMIVWLYDDWSANHMDSRAIKGKIDIDQSSKSWHSWEGTPDFTITACPENIDISDSPMMQNIERVVVFGDSLSDKGTLFEYTQGTVPKSPPYYNGMFSNGNVWAKLFKDDLKPLGIEMSNYAIGGATAYLHIGSYLPYSLSGELKIFRLNAADKNWHNYDRFLSIIWVGGNDYLWADKNLSQADQDAMVKKVISSIDTTIKQLIESGIDKFVLLNLPDLGQVPEMVDADKVKLGHYFSLEHNKALKNLVTRYQHDYPYRQFKLIDIESLFNEVIDDPELINKRYDTEISNVNDPCWRGGFVFDNMAAQQVLNRAIPHTMDILTAIAVANDDKLCSDPEHYLFFDRIHPTSQVHQVLYQFIKEKLGINTVFSDY